MRLSSLSQNWNITSVSSLCDNYFWFAVAIFPTVAHRMGTFRLPFPTQLITGGVMRQALCSVSARNAIGH